MPGDVKSRAQFRLFQAVAKGARTQTGLSKAQAKRALSGIRPGSLPEKVKKRKAEFSRSPITQAILKAFKGMEPKSLAEQFGPDGEPTFPGLILSGEKFPVLDSADVGDGFGILLKAETQRVTKMQDHPTQVGLKLIKAVIVPIKDRGRPSVESEDK